MSWKNMDKKDDDEEDTSFTKEEVKGWIEDGREVEASNLCIGVYGWDGTGKSGVAMDCRTEEEIEEGKEIVVIDLDDSCSSIKQKYFDSDENIVIFQPMVFDDNGDVDSPKTLDRIDALTKYLVEEEDELDLHAVVFDGVDKFKDICGDTMQIEDLNMDPNSRVKNSWNWQIRNRYYKNVMEKIKKLSCHRFYVTHYKEKKEPVAGELQVTGKEINWHWSTDGMLFQKVEMRKEEEEDGTVKFIATVQKAKGALHLENEEYVVAEVSDETEWYGLHDFYNEVM